MIDSSDVMSNVRKALGRSTPMTTPPTPPAVPDEVARLVRADDADLPALFTRRAIENKIKVQSVTRESIGEALIEHLREMKCRRIALADSPPLQKLNLEDALAHAGMESRRWNQMTLDELYDFDAAVTDVYAAVAEVGAIVVQESPTHGRALSLVPNVHIAIVERQNLLPDLVDLFERMTRQPPPTGTVIITGPSKTADIEMNLVTGVHGPGFVKVFLL